MSPKNLRILITAGPTIEPIDPVRFISNRSTGYMGYELAKEAKKRSHKVTLISGPTLLSSPGGVKLIKIETTRELYERVHEELRKSDILIMASAVADFGPHSFSKSKIKSGKSLTLKLVKNPDILKSITIKEREGKILVGFALETEDLLENATKKLKNKNLDLVIANKIDRQNTPFGKGAKAVYILGRSGRPKKLEKRTKTQIACAILDTVEELCYTPF